MTSVRSDKTTHSCQAIRWYFLEASLSTTPLSFSKDTTSKPTCLTGTNSLIGLVRLLMAVKQYDGIFWEVLCLPRNFLSETTQRVSKLIWQERILLYDCLGLCYTLVTIWWNLLGLQNVFPHLQPNCSPRYHITPPPLQKKEAFILYTNKEAFIFCKIDEGIWYWKVISLRHVSCYDRWGAWEI